MPSGYRDVKVNAVVHEHLCEIQLQLREFVALKSDQHAVYEWARDLNVTSEMEPEDMFENISPEVVEEMMHLATEDWHGTRPCLEHLQLAAGQYAQAEKGLKQVVRVEYAICALSNVCHFSAARLQRLHFNGSISMGPFAHRHDACSKTRVACAPKSLDAPATPGGRGSKTRFRGQ